jgi:hypothetical protein
LFAALPEEDRRKLTRPIPTNDLDRQHGFYRSPLDVLRVPLMEGGPCALLVLPRHVLEADCSDALRTYDGECPSRWRLDAACELRLGAFAAAITAAFREQSSFTPHFAELPSLTDDELIQIAITNSVDNVRGWLASVRDFAAHVQKIGARGLKKIANRLFDEMRHSPRMVRQNDAIPVKTADLGQERSPVPAVPSLPVRTYAPATAEDRVRAESARRAHHASVRRVLDVLRAWIPPGRAGRPDTPVDDSSYVRITRLADEAIIRLTPGVRLCQRRRKQGGYESDDEQIDDALKQLPQQYTSVEIECILTSGTVERAAYRYIAQTDPRYRREDSVKQAVYEGRKLLAVCDGTHSP